MWGGIIAFPIITVAANKKIAPMIGTPDINMFSIMQTINDTLLQV